MKYGIRIPESTAAWQAARHLVPERTSESKYEITVYLRPFNTTTTPNAWPMPYLKSKLIENEGSQYFAWLDFCSAQWQILLDEPSYDVCSLVAHQWAFKAARVLQTFKNAAEHFQAHLFQCSQELQDGIKLWINDFIVYMITEGNLLKHLDQFMTISGNTT